MPPPEPRSSTTSPSPRSANAVGLPQPSEARMASFGRQAVSASVYRLDVIGSSTAPPHVPPQHPDLVPAPTSKAAFPYRSRTVLLMSWVLIESSSKIVDVSVKKWGLQQQPVRRSAAEGTDAIVSTSSATSASASAFRV